MFAMSIRLLITPNARSPSSAVGSTHALIVSAADARSSGASATWMHAVPAKLPARPRTPPATVLALPDSVPRLSPPQSSSTSPAAPVHCGSSMCSISTQPSSSVPGGTSMGASVAEVTLPQAPVNARRNNHLRMSECYPIGLHRVSRFLAPARAKVRPMPRHVLSEDRIDPSIREKIAANHRDIVEEVQAAVAAHPLVVVGMKQNPFPRRARKLLRAHNVPFHYLEYGS